MSQNSNIFDYFKNADDAEHRKWSKGEILCSENYELPRLYFLISGRFRVFRTLNSGREMMYRIYLPGSVIGDIEVFTGSEAASCSVQCISPAETLSVSINKLRDNPASAPELIFALGRGIARKLHENSVSEALNTVYPLEIRLAHYYYTFTDSGLRAQNLGQLADWMGCSYRHLTRSLADLRQKGAIIRRGSAGYEPADLKVLSAIAEPMLAEERGRVLFEPGE